MSNSLARETSPYLLQHANNPVDWYPWGREAFDKAKAENKPVLLSVGYAACHWCHVMAHESFEDNETAALMNSLFINVKVDREERPDVDSIYMQAVQAMTGQGGWPMTVVLTPDGDPYWGGTYFPREERPGIPAFKRVLTTVANAWHEKPETVERTAQALRDLYREAATLGAPSGNVSTELLDRAANVLLSQFDQKRGGFGNAPKFPQTMTLDFCLRWWARTGKTPLLDVAHRSFIAMARGGIYDQVGGGFHRYSVDAEWLVPHFEKMLYDNALLIRFGTHLWQATHDDEVARVVHETVQWTIREMTAPNGGFFASLDADSEGHEGIFYVWDTEELDALLGDDAPIARALWNVRDGGNFEGHSILHLAEAPAKIAERFSLSESEFDARRSHIVRTLYDVRAKRVWPGRDEKILAGWNGLMTRAIAEAARVFNNDEWLDVARKNGAFLREHLVRDARVMRVHTAGVTRIPGFLEDHAAVALAFFALHEATGETQWLLDAQRIAGAMREHFMDRTSGAWYDTANDAEPLITRPRDVFDNAVPSGPSLALEVMTRLYELHGDASLATGVIGQLSVQAEPMARWPNGFGHLLGVADLAMFGAVVVVLVGESGSPEVMAMRKVVAERFLPTLSLLETSAGGEKPFAVLRDRPMVGGKATAYVCRGFTCEVPATSVPQLAAQLDRIRDVAVASGAAPAASPTAL